MNYSRKSNLSSLTFNYDTKDIEEIYTLSVTDVSWEEAVINEL